MADTLRNLIGDEASSLLARVRSALQELVAAAEGLDPAAAAAANARLVRDHVDEFFLMVVVGEVKSGKSSFINALLGETVQAEGPLPLTDRIWVLRHGDEPRERLIDEFVHEKAHPSEVLRLFHIVDTPGTNSIIRRHQEITESFIPKADLILFVTSIDRPFSESEHQFLDFVSERWRRKVIFVLTKVDTREPEDVPTVVEYIKANCHKFYEFEPRVFPVSARLARDARRSADAALAERSGLPELHRFLCSNLAEQERVRLKLAAPCEAGLALLEELAAATRRRREVLDQDFRSVNDLDAQVGQSAKELKERYHVYVVDLYDELREFERRGRSFFESTVRVKNFGLLRDPDAFRRAFEKEVVGNLKDRIHDAMHQATDWLMKEQVALFERSLRYLGERMVLQAYHDRVAAPPPSEQGFEYNRTALVQAIQQAFRREIERFDTDGQCQRVVEAAYRGVLAQIGLQAGAVGLGALLVAILSGIALDLTGVLAAGALFAAGFFILPRRKRQLVQEFSARVDQLIAEFRRVLAHRFDTEIEQATDRLRGAYAPYLAFYRAQSVVLDQSDARQAALRLELHRLAEAARSLTPAAAAADRTGAV